MLALPPLWFKVADLPADEPETRVSIVNSLTKRAGLQTFSLYTLCRHCLRWDQQYIQMKMNP
jgi:hypothetical protein